MYAFTVTSPPDDWYIQNRKLGQSILECTK